MLESELFGHEPGAFTGAKGRRRGLIEQAHGGTLFLDEISEMELDLQAKLLKAIEDRRVRRIGASEETAVDIQIIASSNRNMREHVAAGAFRADLYHRLSVITLDLPSLRSRKRDLRDLVAIFLAEFNSKAGKRVREIPDTVWARLEAHDWPGNVRELRNVVERCVLMSEDAVFPVGWLHLQDDPGAAQALPPDVPHVVIPLDGSMSLDEIEQRVIKTALDLCNDNVTGASRLLRSTRETLRYRVDKYGLRSSD